MKLYPATALCIPGIIIRFPPWDIFHLASHSTGNVTGIFTRIMDFTPETLFYLAFGCLIALFLDGMCQHISYLEQKNKVTRDESAELTFLLQDRNRLLIEKQNYEIHTAMLQERTRIAREIHDNAGHMLSRCILLTGMIKTLNSDEKCAESLQLLDSELAKTMDSIRNSVHNLHKESLNLEEKISELLTGFSFCPVSLEYDMGTEVPSSVKYAFLAITKEALTNIAKHSNASKVQLRIVEHPSMYQFVISDNGTNISMEANPENGIGLQNMKDRITALNGTIQFLKEKGFRIFISVPKTESNKEG
ncbi:MAG: two-component sensor histidine kinase [Lachnospiraceae bacterium]|nr:two-component sensor histidine kinase [Lachnospiraceae bacterium]